MSRDARRRGRCSSTAFARWRSIRSSPSPPPDNRASQQVLQKIGLQPAGEAYYYGQWLRFFRLSRAQYLA